MDRIYLRQVKGSNSLFILVFDGGNYGDTPMESLASEMNIRWLYDRLSEKVWDFWKQAWPYSSEFE